MDLSRQRLLEKALLEYVERYGLTEQARKVFVDPKVEDDDIDRLQKTTRETPQTMHGRMK